MTLRITVGIASRVGGLVIVFLGVTFLIYLLVFTLPGDPIQAMVGERPAAESFIKAMRLRYHLDEPLLVQYGYHLSNLFHGDLGTDFAGRSVSEQMLGRWPVTIILAFTAWAIELVVGLSLGIVAALKAGTVIDKSILAITILLSAIPVFVLGVTAQVVFGARLQWFPVAGSKAGWPIAYLMPAIVIAVIGLAAVSRLMRATMLEELGSDYTRTARAKGLAETAVVGIHVMRNSTIPAFTYLATDLGFLLGGTVIIEGIFNLPGVGNLLFTAIRTHEGPTIVGVSTAMILIFLLTSVLVDAVHLMLDPRLRK